MSKPDTSPAALRALADEWDVEGIPIWHTLAQTLRAVADEKELYDAALASYVKNNQTWAYYPNIK
jgi:hypothetical protein